MNDVFGTPEPQNVPEGEPQPPEIQALEPEAGAPPAPENDGQVPLKALEAERAKRREYRDKFHEAQGRLAALEEMLNKRQQEPAQQSNAPVDPVQAAVAAVQNERLNISEMLTRKEHGNEAVDEALKKYQEKVKQDPSLAQRIMGQRDPWGALVKEMQRDALLAEIGDDPVAYKERILAEAKATPTPKTPLPQSLAGARSTASRSAGSFTGPPPLDSLFKN